MLFAGLWDAFYDGLLSLCFGEINRDWLMAKRRGLVEKGQYQEYVAHKRGDLGQARRDLILGQVKLWAIVLVLYVLAAIWLVKGG